MVGYVVDKEGKPLQFRVYNPQTKETSMGIMVVRGSGVTIVDVPPAQLQPGLEQVAHTPSTQRIGALPGEEGAPAMPEHERGVVVADQVEPVPPVLAPGVHPPTGGTAPPAPANGGNEQQEGERPSVLQQGAAQDL